MYVGNHGSIYAETAHPAHRFLANFLVSCCEPVSRTHRMVHYRIDAASLSAASAEGTYTPEMIRHVLRYFSLNEDRELAIDLSRYVELEAWAGSAHADLEPDSLYHAPLSFLHTGEQPETRVVPLGQSEATALCAMERNTPAVVAAAAATATDVPKVILGDSESVRDEATATTTSGRRVLRLGSMRPAMTRVGVTMPTPGGITSSRSGDLDSSTSNDARTDGSMNDKHDRRHVEQAETVLKPSSSSRETDTASVCSSAARSRRPPLLPLVHLAVVKPSALLSALPAALEAMLREEEESSRMCIVLQPRLRRFDHTWRRTSSGGPASRASADMLSASPLPSLSCRGVVQQRAAPREDELFYFLLSRDKARLESVLDCVREFIEPIQLHGATRWVISDVDREAVTASSSSSTWENSEAATSRRHRPNVLRRLFDPHTPAARLFWQHHASSHGCDESAVQQQHDASKRHALAVGMESHDPDCAKEAHREGIPAASMAQSRVVYKSQLRHGTLRHVKERLFRVHGIRADCFYDYAQDDQASPAGLRVRNLTLARHTRLRHYQIASLERFRHGGRAHNGVVVLPCGAGKTLMGIAAAAALQRSTVVMCINNMSVFQWRREFLRWTNLTRDEVTVCTAKQKEMPGRVFITTYSMVIASRGCGSNGSSNSGIGANAATQAAGGSGMGTSAKESEAVLQSLTQQTWGLLLLDEVHAALAHHFQDVLNVIRHKCVLGLSATLLREDDKIADLRHLVGPKLYEANWLELTAQGYLAPVACAEVQCAMPRAFQRAYLCRVRDESKQQSTTSTATSSSSSNNNHNSKRVRRRGAYDAVTHTLASCNPYKLWCTQALLEFHRHRSPPDKVILFCDYLADVRFYAHHLHLPFMDQRTSEAERAHLLQYFQHSNTVNAIILTRVGDVALDLPCASVIIQISGLGASRRQEAQRLGRILRPKPPSLDNTCSYFYTLVSRDTHEMRTSYERQSWLRDQGFGYRVLDGDSVLQCFLRPNRASHAVPAAGASPARTLCCVGPPRWWFQVYPSAKAHASAHWKPSSHPTQQDLSNSGSSTFDDFAGRVVPYDGAHWMSFSAKASACIQHSFARAREGCVLCTDVLGAGALCDVCNYEIPSHGPQHAASSAALRRIGAQESWTVRFSSGDAPNTFGTVTMGEADVYESGLSLDAEDGMAQRARVRRIRCGPLSTHINKDINSSNSSSPDGANEASNAMEGMGACTERCINYALSMLHGDACQAGEDSAAAKRTRHASGANEEWSSNEVESVDDENDTESGEDEVGGVSGLLW